MARTLETIRVLALNFIAGLPRKNAKLIFYEQLARPFCNDRFFRGESVALGWCGLVGMVVPDDCRCASDCHLDGVLEEVA